MKSEYSLTDSIGGTTVTYQAYAAARGSGGFAVEIPQGNVIDDISEIESNKIRRDQSMNKLYMKATLTLEAAKVISFAAEAEAEKNGWAVAIAVTDDRGELIHFIRMDNTTNAAVGIAQKKAFHAANYRRNTTFHEKLLAEGSSNIGVLSLPNCMPIEGGIPLTYEGNVIGAIGVSGVASNNDGRVAQKGSEAFEKLIAD